MTTTERLSYAGKALHYNSLIHDEIKDLCWNEQRYIITMLFYFLSEELRSTYVKEEEERKN